LIPIFIVASAWGDYAKLVGEKSAVGARVLWVLWGGGGLTCCFWAVFEGGFGGFIFWGGWMRGSKGRSRFPEGMTEKKGKGNGNGNGKGKGKYKYGGPSLRFRMTA
jgi:hypothetical protein